MPSRPSRPQRLRVWRGELKKTSGGLMRDDLVKNSKGKIVSRRKSKQAGEQNNLGVWLRSKGDKFGDKPEKELALKAKEPPKLAAKPKPKPKPNPAREKLARRLKTAGVPIVPRPPPKKEFAAPKPKPAAPPKSYGKKKAKHTEITVQNIRRESRAQKKAREDIENRERKKRRAERIKQLMS